VDVTDRIIAIGLDPADGGAGPLTYLRPIHMQKWLPELPHDPIPLCWWAEAEQRDPGGNEGLWAVAVDHDTLPPRVTSGNPTDVNCPDCIEWMHA
jgi:hypothetical protein